MRRSLLDPEHPSISLRRQCDLLGLPRSTAYYAPIPESVENLALMKEIDAVYLDDPSYGSRSITAVLSNAGWEVNRKRVQRLMRLMNIAGVTPKRNTSRPSPGHRVFPYLLRNVAISHPDQVWSTDITYVPLRHGFVYLTAVMDWYSRYVLSWKLSNRLVSAADSDRAVFAGWLGPRRARWNAGWRGPKTRVRRGRSRRGAGRRCGSLDARRDVNRLHPQEVASKPSVNLTSRLDRRGQRLPKGPCHFSVRARFGQSRRVSVDFAGAC